MATDFDLIIRPDADALQDTRITLVTGQMTAEGHSKNTELVSLCGESQLRQDATGTGFVVSAQEAIIPEVKKDNLSQTYQSGATVSVETDIQNIQEGKIQDLKYVDTVDENNIDIKTPSGKVTHEKFYLANITIKPVGVEITNN
jgi:hypothetical protein